MTNGSFSQLFETLTGHGPFPWQEALYQGFTSDDADKFPRSCNIPTGLGKTSVVAVWLIALATRPHKMPRRLVYVVNRRTVVDQTTNEVERLRENLAAKPELAGLRDALSTLIATEPKNSQSVLAISTLRGQYADNREWSADPSRPAVICGTVDMIGSRLLFSGYGVGFRARPLHAGFLGQDALLVHDEAHLEPAFQELIDRIKNEQCRCNDYPNFHVMELTATTRNDKGGAARQIITIEKEDRVHPVVKQRIEAPKYLRFHEAKDDSKIAEEITGLALEHQEKGDDGNLKDAAVLVFVRTLDDVKKVIDKLSDKKSAVGVDCVQQLTGTMRGWERDALADRDPVFMRFLPGKNRNSDVKPAEGTVYLVCTSAGEVGIDISADHMVCDLTTLESMIQRFGRVNRFGERSDTRIDVVHPDNFGDKDKLAPARKATLELLGRLNGDASPKAVSELVASLSEDQRKSAFAPPPSILPATDILFDAWSLTSIRKPMPGRPPVEPYLHGIRDYEPPETYVAWREEVEVITGDLLESHKPEDLLDDYPLKPHELLRDRSDRVFKHLESLAKRHADKPVWIVDDRETIKVTTLEKLADKQRKDRINGCTILLPPTAGGLAGGMLDGDSKEADDVADAALDGQVRTSRERGWDNAPIPGHLRLIRTIDTRPEADDGITDEDITSSRKRYWHWYDLPREGGRTSLRPVAWDRHVNDVTTRAKQIVASLTLSHEIGDAVILAARLHDHGKRRERFQTALGNRDYPNIILAKSGQRGGRFPEPFRHEFASVFDAQNDPAFTDLTDEMKDLVLHLIAAHHGRARPHFETDEAIDPDRSITEADALSIESPRRFGRLQRKYGRWGLAYLESLLRAADWAASANPSEYMDDPIRRAT